jgi:ferrochelatase
MSRRTAVVLLNLGGPDSLDAVRPFLFNLFSDPAIFRLPQPFRGWLAARVAKRRTPVAVEIYRQIGGSSPLLANTEAQATSLETVLGGPEGGNECRVFIAMRYWHPFSIQAAAEIQAWEPDEIVLLPLYPQFSTTTTASSALAWHRAAKFFGIAAPTRLICCYPMEDGFIRAMADEIRPAVDAASRQGTPRLLLSAHGLPERVVAGGDPYRWQCEQTARAILAALDRPGLDWTGCYQSRVGPLKWIGPSTDDEVRRAGADRVPLVVAPIAFVSEHSETLVELDIEYRTLAAESGVPLYLLVPAVGVMPPFIEALARLVRAAQDAATPVLSGSGARICPAACSGCPNRARANPR